MRLRPAIKWLKLHWLLCIVIIIFATYTIIKLSQKEYFQNHQMSTYLTTEKPPMKVAILLSGRIRGYEYLKDNLKNIMDKYNPVVFCSLNKKVKSDYIKGFCEFMKIDDERLNLEVTPSVPEYFNTITPRNPAVVMDPRPEDSMMRYYSLVYHNKRTIELVSQYQDKYNTRFNCILNYRVDLNPSDDLLLEVPEENTIYISNYDGNPHEHAEQGGITAAVYYGNFDTMKIVESRVDHLKDITERDGIPFGVSETSLKKHIENNRIIIKRFQYKFSFHESRHIPNPAYDSYE